MGRDRGARVRALPVRSPGVPMARSAGNFGDGVVTVRRQVLLPGPYVRETTKSRRERTVRLDEVTATSLRRWKAAQAEDRLAFGPAYKVDGGWPIRTEAAWLVTESDGEIVNPDTLLRRWRALVKAAGVKPIPLHGARHTYATLALDANVRLDIVSRQLGHSSVAITADVYGHADDKALEGAARTVGTVLEGAAGDEGVLRMYNLPMSRREVTREMEVLRHRVLVLETEIHDLRNGLKFFLAGTLSYARDIQKMREAGINLAVFLRNWEMALELPGGVLANRAAEPLPHGPHMRTDGTCAGFDAMRAGDSALCECGQSFHDDDEETDMCLICPSTKD